MALFNGSNSAEIIVDLSSGPFVAAGNDFVNALGGDDLAIGWEGDDVIRGGAGADVIVGGQVNDAGEITPSGTDAADYTTSVDGVTVDLSVIVSSVLPRLGLDLELTGATQGFGGDAQGDYLVGIANLLGSDTGDDNLSGNSAANTLNGQSGNDRLDGNSGNDTLLGGLGDDVLIGGTQADALDGGAGTDTADYSGSATPVTVNLGFGFGNGGDAEGDTLVGMERVIGSAGNDFLTGSGGNDTLIGGAAGDTLNGGGGSDTVDYSSSVAAVTVDLVAGIGAGGDAQGDQLANIPNAIGSNTGGDNLGGNSAANTLFGQGGNDRLDGNDGNDILLGGLGDDVLVGGTGDDSLDGGAGTDTADYSGSTPVFVNLATGLGGGGARDTLVGIERVIGSAGDDILTGSDGNDTLIGGAGGDTLNGGGGIDTVGYSGSGSAVDVDLLNHSASGGDASGDTLTDIENLRGSAFGDTLTGDAGDNILNDGGVGGADTLTGLGGNDSYAVYNAGAVIVELDGDGADRVSAGVNYVLASGISAEYFNTTSLHATYAVNLTGNEIAQLVRGNDGANTLDGGGSSDVLFGMGGADGFRFSTALGAGNIDRIGDFLTGTDTIQLDNAIFTALTALGPLDPSAFKDTAFAPKDADDRIIYNSDTGALCYDADGSGTAFGNVRFATIIGSPVLTAADFVVI